MASRTITVDMGDLLKELRQLDPLQMSALLKAFHYLGTSKALVDIEVIGRTATVKFSDKAQRLFERVADEQFLNSLGVTSR